MSLSKAMFRQQIWTYLEDNNIAKFPRPVFNRIPNFKGADQACSRILQLEKYQTASVIKVDPDSPLKKIRYLILKDKKVLLVPTPRLRYGLLNRITPPRNADQQDLEICATSEGVRSHSVKLDLDSNIKIDLVIVGAVAVKPNGRRIGKGEGYSDMEFAMMATLGAVSSDTTVVAVVHDCQVLDDIPEELFQEHDVPVDIIVTPSKVLYCQPRLKKPDYIMWPILSENKFKQIPILQTFKSWEDNKGKENAGKR